MENNITWDFPIDSEIEYFDAGKSYELTGFRPINDTDGLDFDPNWFREDAINKLKTGRYSPSTVTMGSKSHIDWWKERKRRCNEGYTVNGYRLTGDNYFFINFYNLKSSDADTINQDYGFPEFLVFQYEYFHYLELCEKLKKDTSVLKSRGIGFSEMASSFIARPYTTIPNFRSVVSTFSLNHLTPTLSKIWLQMEWLNENTETAFRRVRMNINSKTHKRASVKAIDGSESPDSHKSEVEGLVCDDPDKLRGDRTQILIYEEAGADPVLMKKWVKGTALITVLGGKRVGRKIAFGTGGSSKASSMEGLKKMTLNPVAYNILPVRHNYTKDGKYIISGLFIPAYRIVYEFVDKRGWCNHEAAKNHYIGERAKLAEHPKDLLEYKSEYCFTIEEALIQHSENVFPRDELAEQSAQIEIYKSTPPIHKGSLLFKKDAADRICGVKWKEGDGKIEILEHPMISELGTEYRNLYVGGIDSIDIGSSDSASVKGSAASDKLSEFCIVIKKRVFGQSDPMYVAMYKDRPKDPREAYDNAAKLLMYYGCQAVLESTRTAILTYFRDKKFTHLLMKRPRSTMPDIARGNSQMFGTPATAKVITHYVELVYDFCLDYSHTIAFKEIVDQLLDYSDERKKEFDIVAAMGMCELGDEELSVKKPQAREVEGKQFTDIGWYKDSKGYKHYGPIPKTKEERDIRTRVDPNDAWLDGKHKPDYWQDSPKYRKFSENEWAEYLENNE